MRILLAVDDQNFGEAMADFALKHSWPADTHFRIMSVVPPIWAYSTLTVIPELFHEIRAESYKLAQTLVRKIGLRMRDVLHSTNIEESVVDGHPADEILLMAKQWPADLILIGSHGRQGITRLVLGSVSSAVVSHAPCSVLVVRLTGPAPTSEKATLDSVLAGIPRQ